MPGLTILHGCRTVQLTRGKNTLIDEADWPIVADHQWVSQPADQRAEKWYATRGFRTNGKSVRVWMHRLIADPGEGRLVDHRNGDSLDNRRENLRPCTHAQNMRNKRSVYGASRFKGVCFRRREGMWSAEIRVGGRSHRLGTYSDEREAAHAYDRAARQHFGEFAATNAEIYGEF